MNGKAFVVTGREMKPNVNKDSLETALTFTSFTSLTNLPDASLFISFSDS